MASNQEQQDKMDGMEDIQRRKRPNILSKSPTRRSKTSYHRHTTDTTNLSSDPIMDNTTASGTSTTVPNPLGTRSQTPLPQDTNTNVGVTTRSALKGQSRYPPTRDQSPPPSFFANDTQDNLTYSTQSVNDAGDSNQQIPQSSEHNTSGSTNHMPPIQTTVSNIPSQTQQIAFPANIARQNAIHGMSDARAHGLVNSTPAQQSQSVSSNPCMYPTSQAYSTLTQQSQGVPYHTPSHAYTVISDLDNILRGQPPANTGTHLRTASTTPLSYAQVVQQLNPPPNSLIQRTISDAHTPSYSSVSQPEPQVQNPDFPMGVSQPPIGTSRDHSFIPPPNPTYPHAPSPADSAKTSNSRTSAHTSIDALLQGLARIQMVGPSDLKISTFSYGHDEDFHVWVKEFERVAKAKHWNESDMLLNIPPYLKGFALYEYEAIPEEYRKSWASLKAILLDRLGAKSREDMLQQRLFKIKQRPDEYVEDYHLRMMNLVTKVYRGNNVIRDKDTELRVIFTGGLRDEYTKDMILGNPQTLQQAFTHAVLTEKAHQLDRDSKKDAPNKTLDLSPSSKLNEKLISTVATCMEGLSQQNNLILNTVKKQRHDTQLAAERIAEISNQADSQADWDYQPSFQNEQNQQDFMFPPNEYSNPNSRGEYRCYKCQQTGHFARDCRNIVRPSPISSSGQNRYYGPPRQFTRPPMQNRRDNNYFPPPQNYYPNSYIPPPNQYRNNNNNSNNNQSRSGNRQYNNGNRSRSQSREPQPRDQYDRDRPNRSRSRSNPRFRENNYNQRQSQPQGKTYEIHHGGVDEYLINQSMLTPLTDQNFDSVLENEVAEISHERTTSEKINTLKVNNTKNSEPNNSKEHTMYSWNTPFGPFTLALIAMTILTTSCHAIPVVTSQDVAIPSVYTLFTTVRPIVDFNVSLTENSTVPKRISRSINQNSKLDANCNSQKEITSNHPFDFLTVTHPIISLILFLGSVTGLYIAVAMFCCPPVTSCSQGLTKLKKLLCCRSQQDDSVTNNEHSSTLEPLLSSQQDPQIISGQHVNSEPPPCPQHPQLNTQLQPEEIYACPTSRPTYMHTNIPDMPKPMPILSSYPRTDAVPKLQALRSVPCNYITNNKDLRPAFSCQQLFTRGLLNDSTVHFLIDTASAVTIIPHDLAYRIIPRQKFKKPRMEAHSLNKDSIPLIASVPVIIELGPQCYKFTAHVTQGDFPFVLLGADFLNRCQTFTVCYKTQRITFHANSDNTKPKAILPLYASCPYKFLQLAEPKEDSEDEAQEAQSGIEYQLPSSPSVVIRRKSKYRQQPRQIESQSPQDTKSDEKREQAPADTSKQRRSVRTTVQERKIL